MTLEDPFYVVKDEVFKALNKTRGLYLRWQEISQSSLPPHSPEAEWTSTELKNALRSIQWDLEDLEDTISIVEKNASKFKIDNREISERKKFIENTCREVKMMRSKVTVAESSPGEARGRGWRSQRAAWPPHGADAEDAVPLIEPSHVHNYSHSDTLLEMSANSLKCDTAEPHEPDPLAQALNGAPLTPSVYTSRLIRISQRHQWWVIAGLLLTIACVMLLFIFL